MEVQRKILIKKFVVISCEKQSNYEPGGSASRLYFQSNKSGHGRHFELVTEPKFEWHSIF